MWPSPSCIREAETHWRQDLVITPPRQGVSHSDLNWVSSQPIHLSWPCNPSPPTIHSFTVTTHAGSGRLYRDETAFVIFIQAGEGDFSDSGNSASVTHTSVGNTLLLSSKLPNILVASPSQTLMELSVNSRVSIWNDYICLYTSSGKEIKNITESPNIPNDS